jgi:hypothetical protein
LRGVFISLMMDTVRTSGVSVFIQEDCTALYHRSLSTSKVSCRAKPCRHQGGQEV